MRSTATSGLVFLLLWAPALQRESGWKVNYSSLQICALKGSTVEITCTYSHPSTHGQEKIITTERFWHAKSTGSKDLVDLTTKALYAGRVETWCQTKTCTLRIRDVKDRDSDEYRFRFLTNIKDGGYSGIPGVRLSVTDLRVTKDKKNLKCQKSCVVPDSAAYIWYENGKKITGETSEIPNNFGKGDSISCALKGHEDFPSAPFCTGSPCLSVSYTNRTICAFKGSSVDIECSYSKYDPTSMSWFSPGRSQTWSCLSESEDLGGGSTGCFLSYRYKRLSTLRISNLTDSDSAEYRFTYSTWGRDLHGTTLTVTALQVQVVSVAVREESISVKLKCHSSCRPPGYDSVIWFKGGLEIRSRRQNSRGDYYEGDIQSTDRISCAVKQHRAPEVYAPVSPFVSTEPSGKIVENSFVTLTCSSDANPPANYTWYRKSKTSNPQVFSKNQTVVFISIERSDSGDYHCAAENQLGRWTSGSVSVDVQYAPKHGSVYTSGELVEGSLVTLTCSSDANPPARYSWYKDNQTLPQGQNNTYRFTSIRCGDSGTYHCRAENQHGRINSSSISVDVEYAPKPPSVSVSPSGDVMEGRSVNLTCSSDAKPAASYTWHKETETSPGVSGQTFIIVNVKPEHSGNYYCEARNSRGRHKSALCSIVVLSSVKSAAAAGSITVIVLVVISLSALVLIRRKRSSKSVSESRERPENKTERTSGPDLNSSTPEGQNDLHYASVHFPKMLEDPVYSNIMPAEDTRHKIPKEEDVDYSAVAFSNDTPSLRHQDAEEDVSTLYSTVNKSKE